MNTQRQYPTNLIETQWQLLLTLLPKPKWRFGCRGRPPVCVRTRTGRPVNLRQVFNGILYLSACVEHAQAGLTKTGCQWRMLPRAFGCWQTVYLSACLRAARRQACDAQAGGYFNRWSKQGIFQKIQQALHRRERRSQGRKPTASAGSIDSQSIKTATQGKIKGYDAGKKVNGRKRHLLVDTLGLPICVFVSAADLADLSACNAQAGRDGLMELLKRYFADGLRRLRKLWVDGGYRGDALKAWVSSLKQTHKIDLEVVQRESKGFEVMKWRWVVERTFAWLLNFRRLSKDYEVLTQNSEALIPACANGRQVHCDDSPFDQETRSQI